MKKMVAMVAVLCCLISTVSWAAAVPIDESRFLPDSVKEIASFFESTAEGFNIYDGTGQDITEKFYESNLEYYRRKDWSEILQNLIQNDATLALPVVVTEITDTNAMQYGLHKSERLAGDQEFLAIRNYIPYKDLPNASSRQGRVIISSFKYGITGYYTYNANILDGIIREASATLAIQSDEWSDVGIAYRDNALGGDNAPVVFREIYNANTAANIASNGKSVQFSASFYANFIESDVYYWINGIPFASYFTVTK